MEFLAKLRAESKKDCKVRQADEALRIFFTEVEPVKWVKKWPERIEPIPEYKPDCRCGASTHARSCHDLKSCRFW
jgi:hypothetical protein